MTATPKPVRKVTKKIESKQREAFSKVHPGIKKAAEKEKKSMTKKREAKENKKLSKVRMSSY